MRTGRVPRLLTLPVDWQRCPKCGEHCAWAVMAFTRAAGAPLHPVKRFLSLDSDQIAFKKPLGAPESSPVQPANSIVCSPFPLGQAEEGEHLGSPVPENDP